MTDVWMGLLAAFGAGLALGLGAGAAGIRLFVGGFRAGASPGSAAGTAGSAARRGRRAAGEPRGPDFASQLRAMFADSAAPGRGGADEERGNGL